MRIKISGQSTVETQPKESASTPVPEQPKKSYFTKKQPEKQAQPQPQPQEQEQPSVATPAPSEDGSVAAEPTEEVHEFLQNIRRIPEVITIHDELSQCLRMAMVQMREEPAFVNMLTPEDRGLMLRGARQLRGEVATRKAERTRKSTAKSNPKAEELASELAAALGGGL